jgi:hypothetical protein
MNATAQIFLSYAREDEKQVEELYQKLSAAGLKPWMDKKDILPGERWKPCIQRAIRDSDFFLACLSAKSVKKRSFVQKEIRDALDIWQEKLEDDIYLIPARLDDCQVPESLRDLQWLNLFEGDGWARLVRAIQAGMERQGRAIGESVEVLLELVPEEERPPRYPGLIVLVGAGRKYVSPEELSHNPAIEYHLDRGGAGGEPLRVCWLIATAGTNGSVHVAREVRKRYGSRCDKMILRALNSAFDVQEAYRLVRRIYAEEAAEHGLAPEQIIADFTGGTKPMSVGMVLACRDRWPMQYMYWRKDEVASTPLYVRFKATE